MKQVIKHNIKDALNWRVQLLQIQFKAPKLVKWVLLSNLLSL